ncbi:MAG: hypothetical protein V4724_01915 [Pseudomonadota bacterium]
MTSDELIANPTAQSDMPQSWDVTVTDSKFYWYDLITEFPSFPDFRDPLGRYMRRMQFALEATMEKRLMYLLVSRPRLRFDLKRTTSWGFFSLKLSIPILVGVEQKRDSITIELQVPADATLKKPTVQVFDKFITLNWGSLIETFSVHDLLQNYKTGLDYPSKVHYIGQTRDPAGRLLKGRLSAINRLCDLNAPENDNFVLIQRLDISTGTWRHPNDDGSPLAKDLLLKDQMDVLECVLIKYFEGNSMRIRGAREQAARQGRLRTLQTSYQLRRLQVDLGLETIDAFQNLFSDHAGLASRHVFECTLKQGETFFKRPGTA